MSQEEHSRTSSHQSIEYGDIYNHTTHGRVEITGIWQGTRWVDRAPPSDEHRPVIIRYIPAADSDWQDEIATTREDFLDSIETDTCSFD